MLLACEWGGSEGKKERRGENERNAQQMDSYKAASEGGVISWSRANSITTQRSLFYPYIYTPTANTLYNLGIMDTCPRSAVKDEVRGNAMFIWSVQ